MARLALKALKAQALKALNAQACQTTMFQKVPCGTEVPPRWNQHRDSDGNGYAIPGRVLMNLPAPMLALRCPL